MENMRLPRVVCVQYILLVSFEMDELGMESSFTFVVCVRGPANPHCPKPFWVFGSLALLFLLDKQNNLGRLIDVVIFHAICIYQLVIGLGFRA